MQLHGNTLQWLHSKAVIFHGRRRRVVADWYFRILPESVRQQYLKYDALM